mmetsp:Transcript_24624/g.37434  ORF Transcript_24624/g.37434 Transcript_24624/m.37434 type:complete len:83 (-) Transcript_24624:132-380(-)
MFPAALAPVIGDKIAAVVAELLQIDPTINILPTDTDQDLPPITSGTMVPTDTNQFNKYFSECVFSPRRVKTHAITIEGDLAG